MKITNTQSGKAYHLNPDTQIEIERTNLFFNEYGEQSLPLTLPDTEHNRQLCGYPDILSTRNKPRTDIEVTINEGSYFSVARQAILGAKRKEGISTSFYLNEGAFLSKLKNTPLKEVFGEETIPGVETVQQALDFCKSLLDNNNEQFSIFQALVDDGEYSITSDSGRIDTYALIYVNQVLNGEFVFGTPQTIKREDSEIQLPAGCYITPFIRANYLLKRLFAHFGYTLEDNFFTRTRPFDKMVLLNNTCDAIVNGRIRLTDLVPDVTCGELLDVFRKKFFCEFFPDEIGGTINVKLFNELLDEKANIDIDFMIDGEIDLDFAEGYREIVLKSKYTLSAGEDVDVKNGANDVLNSYPNAQLDGRIGAFICDGFTYNNGRASDKNRVKVVSSSSTPYNNDSGLDSVEIEVPEMQPEFRRRDGSANISPLSSYYQNNVYICIGKARWQNSTLLIYGQNSEDVPDAETVGSGKDKLYPMLCFSKKYDDNTYSGGTILDTTTIFESRRPGKIVKWSDYSLTFNGENGIFEKFYRRYDDILRNSFHIIRARLLLEDRTKMEMSAIAPVVIQGMRALPDVIRYTIGSEKSISECTFRTIRLYEQTNHANDYTGILWGDRDYKWTAHQTSLTVSKSEYDAALYKDKGMDMVYPSEFPTAAMADSGQRYYEREWYEYHSRDKEYLKYTFWLSVEPVTSD